MEWTSNIQWGRHGNKCRSDCDPKFIWINDDRYDEYRSSDSESSEDLLIGYEGQ